jgi:hypothetical protein
MVHDENPLTPRWPRSAATNRPAARLWQEIYFYVGRMVMLYRKSVNVARLFASHRIRGRRSSVGNPACADCRATGTLGRFQTCQAELWSRDAARDSCA